MLLSLIILGILGGLITGISPCILPILPVILVTGGADSARTASVDNGQTDTVKDSANNVQALFSRRSAALTNTTSAPTQRTASRWRPYQVVGGLVLSFSLFTLLGSVILAALHLPQDTLRILGITFLIIVGLSMFIPPLERLLEKPFAKFSKLGAKRSTTRGGFLMGLALGLVYVPCAGPVLAAITLAGATGNIGVETVALTLSFALGTAIPLLIFALAGRSIAERVKTFRTHQRGVRTASGILLIALSIGLIFNVPAQLQRAIPNYTEGIEQAISQGTQNNIISSSAGGAISTCRPDEEKLQDCGSAPELTGGTGNFNTKNQPTLTNLRGKVTLVDFWAYSCINCQRTAPHLNELYAKYRDYGLEIVGVHTPEYAFEHEAKNVQAGIENLGIKYPVVQDNDYAIWRAYSNRYWPAHYLVDSEGKLRAVHYGEGGHKVTEAQVRELLKAANPQVQLPDPIHKDDAQEQTQNTHDARTPETYLGAKRAMYFAGHGNYSSGTQTFKPADRLDIDHFDLNGTWAITPERIEPQGSDGTLRINYRAHGVQVVAGGSGTIEVRRNGTTEKIHVDGAPNAHHIVRGDEQSSGIIELKVSPGVQLYSLTFS